MKETDKSFYISADRIPQKVCQIIVKEHPDYVEEIVANSGTSGKCIEGDNTVYFYINREMSTAPDDDRFDRCDDVNPCVGCGVCTEGRCMDSDDKCVSGEYCVQGTCQGCKKGEIKAIDGTCKACSHPEVINATKDVCGLCPEREWVRTAGGSCQIKCGVGVNAGKPLRHFYFGRCSACDSKEMVDVSNNPSSCKALCPNRELKHGACYIPCPPDKPLQYYGSGTCFSCDYTGYVWLGETGGMRAFCAELCPNRVLIGQGSQFCNLPCGDGTIEAALGNCVACSKAEDIYIGVANQRQKDKCNACPNRVATLGDVDRGQNPIHWYCNRKIIP